MPRAKDLEKHYRAPDVVAKLRRLADALEANEPFRIQISGRRVTVPPGAIVMIEHEVRGREEEVDIELKWMRG